MIIVRPVGTRNSSDHLLEITGVKLLVLGFFWDDQLHTIRFLIRDWEGLHKGHFEQSIIWNASQNHRITESQIM